MDEWEKYELHHRARLAIKPGLTGMWQVSGRSEITDFEEVVKLDTKYISEWSFMGNFGHLILNIVCGCLIYCAILILLKDTMVINTITKIKSKKYHG